MVKRVIQMMYKEVRGLHQAAYVLAFFTFGSQLLALLRDRMLASEFGAGTELDIYYTAFRIPDLLYVLFASTLSVYVLIPFVSARMQQDTPEKARQLLSEVFTVFLLVYSVLALVIMMLAPYIVPLAFPGMMENADQVVLLLRILLLQPLLLGISSLFGVVTQLGHRFVLYAISPLIYNVGIIIGIVLFYPYVGLAGLAWGVVLGALGHMLVQLPLVRNSALTFAGTTKIVWSDLREILAVSIPRAATLAMHQVLLLLLVGIASMMTVGSVSVFQFAYNLQSVPLAVIGASYSIAAFPLLADLFAQKKMEEFRLHIVTALRHIIFWSLPVIGLVIVLRAQMVRVVLGSGEFDWSDTRLTAAMLALLAVSLFAQAINLLIIRVFYAGGYTRIPFFVTLFGSVLASLSVYILYVLHTKSLLHMELLEGVMRVDAVQGSEVLLIAIGYSFAMLVQSALLLFFMRRTFALSLSGLGVHFIRAFLATLFGGFTAYVALNFFVFGIDEQTFLGIFLQGFLAGLFGIVGVISAYYVLRSPELTEIYKSYRGRFFKTKVVTVQDEIV